MKDQMNDKKRSPRSEFGIEVKTELFRMGRTSRQLAKAVGIADSTICDIIAGRNQSEKSKERIREVLARWRENMQG